MNILIKNANNLKLTASKLIQEKNLIKDYGNKKGLKLSSFEIYNNVSSKKWLTFTDFRKILK